MRTVTYQQISEPNPTHIITECSQGDNRPSCGAGYKVGLSACEYCKTQVVSHSKPVAPPNQVFGMGGYQPRPHANGPVKPPRYP